MSLFNLSNIAESSFSNFAKVLLPIGIILVILFFIKWFQSINQKLSSSSGITVIRGPSS
jgi:hypothetical protein